MLVTKDDGMQSGQDEPNRESIAEDRDKNNTGSSEGLGYVTK